MLKTLQELNLRKIIDVIVEYILEYKQLSLILLGIFLVIRAYIFLNKNKNRLYKYICQSFTNLKNYTSIVWSH